jgi:uncharacterized protein YxjI
MSTELNRNLFFIKEHIGMFKAANNYDVLDPESQELVLTCREPKLGFLTKLLRFTKYKNFTPFNIEICTANGQKLLSVKKGISLLRAYVDVLDENDQLIGKFKQRLLSIGGKFDVFDEKDQEMCTLSGKWTSWEFKFMHGDQVLAEVTKKWAGIGKELFTTADNYILSINEKVPADDPVRKMIVAAVMCIDMVLKER